MNNSTPNGGVDGHVRIVGNGKPNNLNMLQQVGSQVEFGDRFAYRYCEVEQTNQTRGNNVAKKTLKKSKKLEATKPLTVAIGRKF